MQAHLPAHHLAELANGNATGLIADCNENKPDGCGGGIFIHDAHPIIVNNVAAVTAVGFIRMALCEPSSAAT